MQEDLFVVMAAYGDYDYGPRYINMEDSHPKGGYETGYASRVAPEVEQVLINDMQELLQVTNRDIITTCFTQSQKRFTKTDWKE